MLGANPVGRYAHHCMTVALLILAMYKGCLRYGLVVLFLHDASVRTPLPLPPLTDRPPRLLDTQRSAHTHSVAVRAHTRDRMCRSTYSR